MSAVCDNLAWATDLGGLEGLEKIRAGGIGDMNVFTFYSNVPELPAKEQRDLLGVWKKSWEAHGWTPFVLGPYDIPKNVFRTYAPIFQKYPTVNPKEYELACFMRWLAMAERGGICTDYDVMNFGFVPSDIPKNPGSLVTVFADDNPCPCAVYGTKLQYANTVKMFINHRQTNADIERGDRPHVSDQNILQKNHEQFRPFILNHCREFGASGWETAKLVHFAHGACHGRDRLVCIAAAKDMRA